MDKTNNHLYDLSLPLRKQLRVTARVGLGISVVSTLALIVTLFLLFHGQQQENYLLIVQSLTQSQDRLLPVMFIGGAMILVLAGLIIWFVLLYSSARIAGPLYRFKKNIELEINQGPVPTIKLRKGDYLQELSAKLSGTAQGLMKYYDSQLAVVDALEQHLRGDNANDSESYQQLLSQLNQTVKIDQS